MLGSFVNATGNCLGLLPALQECWCPTWSPLLYVCSGHWADGYDPAWIRAQHEPTQGPSTAHLPTCPPVSPPQACGQPLRPLQPLEKMARTIQPAGEMCVQASQQIPRKSRVYQRQRRVCGQAQDGSLSLWGRTIRAARPSTPRHRCLPPRAQVTCCLKACTHWSKMPIHTCHVPTLIESVPLLLGWCNIQ